jgi:RHS repeat-associated protein
LASEYQRDVNDPSVDSERNEFLYSGLDLLAEYWLLDASTPSAGSLDSTADTNTYRTEYTLANLQPQAPGLLASQAVPIARTEYPTDGSTTHLTQRTDYFHPDGRGNVAGYTNGDGYTQQTYAYDAFGQELPNAASGDAGRAERDLNNIRFASKPFTPTPGSQPSERDTLQYYGARYYDNALAQWATADSYRGTLSLPETLHRYAFVGNSPTAGGEWYGWFLNGLFNSVSQTVSNATQAVSNVAKQATQAVGSAVKAGAEWAVENRDAIAVGAAIGVAVVATVATGGAAAPLLVGAIAATTATGATVAINAADKHVLGNQERNLVDGALKNAGIGFSVGLGIGSIGSAFASTTTAFGAQVGASALQNGIVSTTQSALNLGRYFTTTLQTTRAISGVSGVLNSGAIETFAPQIGSQNWYNPIKSVTQTIGGVATAADTVLSLAGLSSIAVGAINRVAQGTVKGIKGVYQHNHPWPQIAQTKTVGSVVDDTTQLMPIPLHEEYHKFAKNFIKMMPTGAKKLEGRGSGQPHEKGIYV